MGIPAAGGLDRLNASEEREFGQALDRRLSGMLPVSGAVFGVGVLLFSARDYWISPQEDATSALLRLALVLPGSIGDFHWHGRIPVAWRCGLVYVTHTAAMILSASLLPDGLVLALPADIDALLAAADVALYRAKSNGRDRVELALRASAPAGQASP